MSNILLEEKKKISIGRHVLLTLLAGSFALGIFIGTTVNIFTPFPTGRGEAVSGRTEGTFRFIRASLDSKNPVGSPSNKELKPFKYKVNGLIENSLKGRDAVSISFYFRDLNTGNRFGVGSVEKFLTRTQWKLPLMIAYFKWSESNPLVLRKTITYTKTADGTEPTRTTQTKEITPGKSYTVNDLIYRMIVYNDGAAYALLYANLPPSRLEKILKDLDVEYDPNKTEDALSLNSFAAFYRVLFNASYLSEEMSEKALRYLSQSAFRDGMASGVPPNIEIASKHDDRIISGPGGNSDQKLHQLYEFGIVYHPIRPFLLGVMARGDDFPKLVKAIRDTTRLVYDEIDQQSRLVFDEIDQQS
jgi:beta-lactamase class A